MRNVYIIICMISMVLQTVWMPQLCLEAFNQAAVRIIVELLQKIGCRSFCRLVQLLSVLRVAS